MLEPYILRDEWLGTRPKKKSVSWTFSTDFYYFCCSIGNYRTRSHTLWKIGGK